MVPNDTTANFSSTVTSTSNPLVANYSIVPPAGSQLVSVEFGPDTNYGWSTWQIPAPYGAGSVSVLVAGMPAESTYHMRALVQLQNGAVVPDVDHAFTTGALPAEHLLPKLDVTVNRKPTPGVELVNMNPLLPVVCNLDGEIIWYYSNATDLAHNGHSMPIKNLPNGNFMALITNRYTGDKDPYCVLREIDLAGDTVTGQYGLRELTMPDLNTMLLSVPTSQGTIVQVNYYSHDFAPLPNGHVILLCQQQKSVEAGGPPVPTLVWGDALVDLDETLTPVWVWSGFDVHPPLDINRHPLLWEPDHDWTHCNAIVPTPDGNLMLSVRNQSWVFKLDYAGGTGSGDVLWTLGYEGNFTLQNEGPADWFYAQHFPWILRTSGDEITQISVVDNGNYRIGSDPPPYSRGLIVDIDEPNMTANVAWQWPQSPDFYSYWGGNVVELSSGNMEICMSEPSPTHSFSAEVTYSGENVVWRIQIAPPAAYRCYRIPSLYPGVQW